MAFAETCPQYLFLSLDDLGNGFEGAKFVCSPPLRPKDHLGRPLERPRQGRPPGRRRPTTARSTSTARRSSGVGDFRKIPNGLPGVEDRVDLLHDGGVVGGRISRERWVEIISTAPAKLFGMYPRKGASRSAPTPTSSSTTRTAGTRSRPRRTTWTSTTRATRAASVQGGSDVVLSAAARSSSEDGEFTGRKGHGRFIKRDAAGYVRQH